MHVVRRSIFVVCACTALVMFLYLTRQNHREEYNKHKFIVISYHALIIFFEVVIFVKEFSEAVHELDPMRHSLETSSSLYIGYQLWDSFPFVIMFLIIFFKRNEDVLMCFSKLSN